MELKDEVFHVSAIQYKGVIYLVDYFNYADESETGEIEFICIDHENYYLVDKTFEPTIITESMLKADETSELYTRSIIKL